MVFCCFIDGDTVMFLMFFCIPTNQTDELLIILTEELEFLTVQTAELFRPCRSSLTPLLSQGVRKISQCQITWRLSHWKYFLTDRARLEFTLSPPLLKTVLAEAVTTQQDYRILKYVTAHRTGAVHFRWRFIGSHSVVVFRSCLLMLDSDRQLTFTFNFTDSLVFAQTALTFSNLVAVLSINTLEMSV